MNMKQGWQIWEYCVRLRVKKLTTLLWNSIFLRVKLNKKIDNILELSWISQNWSNRLGIRKFGWGRGGEEKHLSKFGGPWSLSCGNVGLAHNSQATGRPSLSLSLSISQVLYLNLSLSILAPLLLVNVSHHV